MAAGPDIPVALVLGLVSMAGLAGLVIRIAYHNRLGTGAKTILTIVGALSILGLALVPLKLWQYRAFDAGMDSDGDAFSIPEPPQVDVSVSPPPEGDYPPGHVWILLDDGDTVSGKLIAFEYGQYKVEVNKGHTRIIAWNVVREVRFLGPPVRASGGKASD